MQYNICQQICYHAILCVLLSGNHDSFVKGSNNYPSKEYCRKPCIRRNNTIAFQARICTDDGKGGFEQESVESCTGQFKNTCPEFNQAKCVVMEFDGKKYPCCALKYYAEKRTWIEIFYTNQYPLNAFPGNPLNDIIEISRVVKKDCFHERDQPNWPNNVPDASQERGLRWTVVDKPAQPQPSVETNLCKYQHVDGRCQVNGSIYEYMLGNYPTGFENTLLYIQKSGPEYNDDMKESYSLDLTCIHVLHKNQVVPACQILYSRNAFAVRAELNTSFVFLEANVYFADPKDKSFQLRYAYYSVENPKYRNELFAQPLWQWGDDK